MCCRRRWKVGPAIGEGLRRQAVSRGTKPVSTIAFLDPEGKASLIVEQEASRVVELGDHGDVPHRGETATAGEAAREEGRALPRRRDGCGQGAVKIGDARVGGGPPTCGTPRTMSPPMRLFLDERVQAA